MDTAFVLKPKIQNNEHVDNLISMLESSEIIKKYSSLENLTDLGKIFSLIRLSEIPFANELELTKKLIDFINTSIATEKGFSYTREVKDIVPCYNAMLLESYCRFGKMNLFIDIQDRSLLIIEEKNHLG